MEATPIKNKNYNKRITHKAVINIVKQCISNTDLNGRRTRVSTMITGSLGKDQTTAKTAPENNDLID